MDSVLANAVLDAEHEASVTLDGLFRLLAQPAQKWA
jgi:hypothetical protein